LRLRRGEGNAARIADSLADFANVAKWEGDYASARALNEESLALARQQGDRSAIAFALRELGILASIGGDDIAAAALHQQAVALFRDLGNVHGVAISVAELGRISHRRGDDESALSHLRHSVSLFQCLEDGMNVAETMLALAAVEPDPQRATRLMGAARRAVDGASLPVWLESEYRRDVNALRHRLDERVFAAAWDSGRALSMVEAVEIAIGAAPARGLSAPDLPEKLELGAGVTADTPTHGPRLTAREMEVLHLLAAGKSNREIAAALVLSIRTVETHVARVYQKIGAANRAEASAYAVRHGMA
jgi:non-specific serine/threonine protein kinase